MIIMGELVPKRKFILFSFLGLISPLRSSSSSSSPSSSSPEMNSLRVCVCVRFLFFHIILSERKKQKVFMLA